MGGNTSRSARIVPAPAQVRVGINAPKDLPVHREEVYERIRAGQQIAAPGADGVIGRNRAASSDQSSRIRR